MKILAVDYGDSRTGLATCDRTEFLTTADGDIGRLPRMAEGAPGGGLNAPAAPAAKFLCEVRTVCCKVRRKSSFSGLFSQFS